MRHTPHRQAASLSIWFASILVAGCSELTTVSGRETGSLQITASSTGAAIDLDPDGFTVTVDDGAPALLPVAGLTVKGLTVGTHSVKLGGVAANCSVNGTNPRSVDVTRNSSEAIPFGVDCQPNVGSLRVTTVTTGEEISLNGYTVFLPSKPPFGLPVNGVVTIPNLRAGGFNLGLYNVAPNCDHVGSPVRSVQIVFGLVADVGFTLRCVATGRFQITTRTTGEDRDEDGYLVEVSQPAKGTVSSVQLPQNGTTDVIGLPPGDFTLKLSGVINNCTANLAVLYPVRIQAGSTTPVTFDIGCEATRQIAFTTGTGFGSALQMIRSNGTGNFRVASQSGSNLDPDWSNDGSRLAFTSDRDGGRDIYAMDPDGKNVVRLTNAPGTSYRPDWSPDGKRIAFVSQRDGNAEIYVMDADGRNAIRLTSSPGNDTSPSWSPDGTRIAFQSDRDGFEGIYIMNADGSNAARMIGSLNGDRQPSWSPDGTKIAFSRSDAATVRDIFMLNVDGTRLTRLSANYSDATDPAWSPDGLQIAFSASFCSYSFYYYSDCETDILLARADGKFFSSTPILAKGYNPAWRP